MPLVNFDKFVELLEKQAREAKQDEGGNKTVHHRLLEKLAGYHQCAQHKLNITENTYDLAHLLGILENIFNEGKRDILQILNNSDASDPSDHSWQDVMKIIGECLFLGSFLFSKASCNNKKNYDFYFWPGYNKLDDNGKTQRLSLKDENHHDCGMGIFLGGDKVTKYESCTATYWFHKILSPRLYEKWGIYPGSTHLWVSTKKRLTTIDGYPLRILCVKHEESKDDPDQEVLQSYGKISIQLSSQDIKSWGRKIAERIKENLIVFDQDGEVGDHPWPKISESIKKDLDFATAQEISEKLYTIWLAAYHSPDKLNVVITELFPVKQHNDITSKIRNSLITSLHDDTWQQYHHHYFSNWFTFAMQQTVDVAESKGNLGSAMILNNFTVHPAFFRHAGYWVEIIYRDLRMLDVQMFLEARKKSEIEAQKSQDELNEVQHLRGLEHDVKQLVDEVDKIRSRAINIRQKLSPATVGLPARAQELLPLLEAKAKIYVYVWDADVKLFSSFEKFEEAVKNPIGDNNQKSSITSFSFSLKNEKIEKPEGPVSPTDEVYGKHKIDWNCPGGDDKKIVANIFKVVNVFSRIAIIKVLESLSRNVDETDQNLKNKFAMLKLLVQRHVAPDYTKETDYGSQIAYLYDAQLLMTILEAAFNANESRGITITYSNKDVRSDSIKFTDIDGAVQLLCEKDRFTMSPQDQLRNCRHNSMYGMFCSLLPEDKRPVDLLGPLYCLIREELKERVDNANNSPEEESVERYASLDEVWIDSSPDEVFIAILCKGMIPLKQIHSKDESLSGKHGMSAALWVLADAVGETAFKKKLSSDEVVLENLGALRKAMSTRMAVFSSNVPGEKTKDKTCGIMISLPKWNPTRRGRHSGTGSTFKGGAQQK